MSRLWFAEPNRQQPASTCQHLGVVQKELQGFLLIPDSQAIVAGHSKEFRVSPASEFSVGLQMFITSKIYQYVSNPIAC